MTDLTDLELRALINWGRADMLREEVMRLARQTMENAERYERNLNLPTDFGYIDRRKALRETPGDRPAPGWQKGRTENMARHTAWKLTK